MAATAAAATVALFTSCSSVFCKVDCFFFQAYLGLTSARGQEDVRGGEGGGGGAALEAAAAAAGGSDDVDDDDEDHESKKGKDLAAAVAAAACLLAIKEELVNIVGTTKGV